MSLPLRTAIMAWFVLAVFSNFSVAGLVIDPIAGSTAVLTAAEFAAHGQVIDDQIFQSNFGTIHGPIKLFGSNLSQLSISANGNLTNIAGPDTFFTSSFAQGNALLRIAPLWDDFIFLDPALSPGAPVNQIYEKITSDYYSVTWHNVRLHLETSPPSVFPMSLMSAQVIMFAAQTTLRGFQFQANDIVFGYTSQTATTGQFSNFLEAETGLNLSSGIYSRLPLPDNQLVTDIIAAAVLPWQPNNALLFRPTTDGSGNFLNYNVNSITLAAIPEPAWLAWCCVAGGLACRRLHRHRKTLDRR